MRITRKRASGLVTFLIVAAAAGTGGAAEEAAPGEPAEPAAPAGAIASAAAASVSDTTARRFDWTGSLRARYSRLLNQFRPGLAGDDQALAIRTVLGGRANLPRLSVVVEWQDARAYLTDEQSGVSTNLVNAFELLQAAVHLPPRPGRPALPDLLAGRLTYQLGSGRLIAAEAYRDAASNHTGVIARWSFGESTSLTALRLLPVRIQPFDVDSLIGNEIEVDDVDGHLALAGLMFEQGGLPLGGTLGVVALDLDESDDGLEFTTRNRQLETVGLRFSRAPSQGQWDFDTEHYGQRGTTRATTNPADQRDLDVDASLHLLHVGFTLRRPWSPRIALEFETASGDRNPVDGSWQRFDPLFGNRRIDLAPTSIYAALGHNNIETLGLRLSFTPDPRTDAFAAMRSLRLVEASDAFASTGVRDPTGQSGRDGGFQLDLRVRHRPADSPLRLEGGLTQLWNGNFLDQAPNATREGDTSYIYFDVTIELGSRSAAAPAR